MLGFSPADLSYKVVEGFDYYSEDFVNIGYTCIIFFIINFRLLIIFSAIISWCVMEHILFTAVLSINNV